MLTLPRSHLPGLRPTKLICTLGPASVGQVDALVGAGMDVARVNWSHGDAASRAAAVAAVREAAGAAERAIPVLADLPGPKIRLGSLVGGLADLAVGARFELRLGTTAPGDASGAGVSYPGLAADLQVGDHVFLADGAVELVVRSTDAVVVTEVVRGGVVRSRQGVSIPSDHLTMPSLTADDLRHLDAILVLGAELVAQSFVRGAGDVLALRAALGPDGPPIVAKIETRAAVDTFDDILDVADAVMIARGDLGVELPFEDVPLIQKDLVGRALARGVPSIVATQMLESMTGAPRPTRAEVSDVANAVFDGADALLLSGETAIGAFPVLAAEAAARITRRCATGGARWAQRTSPPTDAAESDGDALAAAAVSLVRSTPDVQAIVCRTTSGRTAIRLARRRPGVPIVAITSAPRTAALLALMHGVTPHLATATSPDPGPEMLDAIATGILGEAASGAVVVVDGATADHAGRLELRRPGGER